MYENEDLQEKTGEVINRISDGMIKITKCDSEILYDLRYQTSNYIAGYIIKISNMVFLRTVNYVYNKSVLQEIMIMTYAPRGITIRKRNIY